MKRKKRFACLIICTLAGMLVIQPFAEADDSQTYVLRPPAYSLYVNHKEYYSSDLPVLNFNGNTYIPLKAVGELLGASVSWDESLRRVEIQPAAATALLPDAPTVSASLFHRPAHEVIARLDELERWTVQVLFRTFPSAAITPSQKYAVIGKLTERYGEEAAQDLFAAAYRADGDLYHAVPTNYRPIGSLNNEIRIATEESEQTLTVTVSGEVKVDGNHETLLFGPFQKKLTIHKKTGRIIEQTPLFLS